MTGAGKNAIDILLAESLKELAATKAIEKITIKEITDKAGVIRPTFYNHFQDKYELIEWIITNELLLPMQPLVKAGMITEAMQLLFTNIEKEAVFYKKAVKMEGAITFHDIDMKCVRAMLESVIEEIRPGNESKHKWLTTEVVAAYYAQTMCFAAEQWISLGMTIPPKEMSEACYHIMTHSMEEIIEEL